MDTDFLASEVDGFDDPNAGDGEQGGDGDGNDGGTTKFHTYEEPDLSNPSIDVDIDAVVQFVNHHATTEGEDESQLKTPTETLINVFTKWAEINGVDLDQLDSDLPSSNRKGNLTPILNKAFDIEKGQRRIDTKPTSCYFPISLNESVKDIME